MEKNSVLVKNSRFVSGGSTEINDRAIEWWERFTFTPQQDDQQYIVERRFKGRLDLIAAAYLGDPRLWWVIAMLNGILDPYHEVVEGRILRIPSDSRVKLILSGKIGGVPSTREVPKTVFPIV